MHNLYLSHFQALYRFSISSESITYNSEFTGNQKEPLPNTSRGHIVLTIFIASVTTIKILKTKVENLKKNKKKKEAGLCLTT